MRSFHSAEMMDADCLPGAPGVPADPPVGVRHAVRHFQRHLPAGASSLSTVLPVSLSACAAIKLSLIARATSAMFYKARRMCMAYLNSYMSYCVLRNFACEHDRVRTVK